MTLRKILLGLVLLLSGLSASGQQDILVSQYMFNHLLLNPGYAGSKDYMMASLLYRKQWVDFKGAPETQIASIHGPVGLTNLGWGVLLSHDKIGVTDRTDAYLNAAYHLKAFGKSKLSLGLRAGGGYYPIRTVTSSFSIRVTRPLQVIEQHASCRTSVPVSICMVRNTMQA